MFNISLIILSNVSFVRRPSRRSRRSFLSLTAVSVPAAAAATAHAGGPCTVHCTANYTAQCTGPYTTHFTEHCRAHCTAHSLPPLILLNPRPCTVLSWTRLLNAIFTAASFETLTQEERAAEAGDPVGLPQQATEPGG